MTEAPRAEARLAIVNEKGLHARASAKFVAVAERFSASITVSKDGYDVSGASIMGLLLLTASKGSTIAVVAAGDDADAAIAALSELVESGFGETD